MLSSQQYKGCPKKSGLFVAPMVKNSPAMRETWVRFLGWEDPLEKEMATHSSILAWRIPWTEELGRLQSTGSQSLGREGPLQKGMATHSCILAGTIPWTEEPGEL